MKTNTAKRRMLDGKPAVGITLGLGSPIAAEALSRSGFDFVLVDNQHGAWDELSSMMAFRTIALGPAIPMARVKQNDYYAIGRLLDLGAMGIVVPMVDTVEEARAAAQAVRYPPRGQRSMGPRLAEFHGADYATSIDQEMFLAVQIESAQAVESAEKILAVDGVDGCWIGPNDLALSMGVDLKTPAGAEAHRAAILRVLEACRKTGKIPGISGSNDYEVWINHGFQFVTASSDLGLLNDGARQILHKLGRDT